mmetsp:Transcript_66920/g.139730  ORF Transcript_66920/g.139730 Transcript_66920/m.139730 type:complete len:225 (-) Transcript_66920:508-1182(-)
MRPLRCLFFSLLTCHCKGAERPLSSSSLQASCSCSCSCCCPTYWWLRRAPWFVQGGNRVQLEQRARPSLGYELPLQAHRPGSSLSPLRLRAVNPKPSRGLVSISLLTSKGERRRAYRGCSRLLRFLLHGSGRFWSSEGFQNTAATGRAPAKATASDPASHRHAATLIPAPSRRRLIPADSHWSQWVAGPFGLGRLAVEESSRKLLFATRFKGKKWRIKQFSACS